MGTRSGLVGCASLAVVAFLLGRYVLPAPGGSHVATLEDFETALSSSDWISRAQTISAFAESMTPDELPGAIALVEERRRWMSQDEQRLFMIAWARIDAPGAFERALTWPDYTRNKGAASALYAWALTDPHGARAAMESVNDAALRELLVARLVAAWSHGPDKAGVTRYIAEMPEAGKREKFTSVLAREILSGGGDQLIAWADSIRAGSEYKPTAFGKAAGVLAQHDPVASARWVEEHLGEPWAREAPSIVARRWAERDPVAAMTWVRGLPPGGPRYRAAARAYSTWVAASPLEAAAWLDEAPRDGALDAAWALQIRRTAATSPEQAVELLAALRNARVYEESVVQIALSWRLSDRSAADAWLATIELSDEARAAIEAGHRRTRRPGRGAPSEAGEPSPRIDDPATAFGAAGAESP